MARIVVPYDKFAGDFGRLGPYNAPPGTFDALNMYVNRFGELMVRPGLRNVTPTGVAAGATTYLAPLQAGQTNQNDEVVYFQTGTAKKFPVHQCSAFTASSVGSFGVTAVDDDAVGTDNTYAVTGGASIGLGVSSATPGTGGGVSCAVYINRFVVAASGAVLKYSDVGGENGSSQAAGAPDFAHFTATNALTIGDSNEAIVAIRAQKTHLVVFKTNSIYTITGDMRTATVRQVTRTNAPFDSRAVKRTRDEMLWFVPSPSMTPWSFDGTKAREFDRIIVPSLGNVGGGQVAMAPLPSEDQAVFILSIDPTGSATKSYGWLFYNGVWTKHTFPVSFAQQVAGVQYFALDDPGLSTSSAPYAEATLRAIRQVSTLVFSDQGSTPTFYGLTVLDRPGSETQPLNAGVPTFSPERAGDNATAQVAGSVNFPEWHSQNAEEALVRSVIVDFRSFNTGGSLTNHFDLTVNALRTWNAASPVGSQTLAWDEVGSVSATGGTVKRQVFSFGDQGLGNGFQIALANVRGVAIRRIQVIAETQPLRSAA